MLDIAFLQKEQVKLPKVMMYTYSSLSLVPRVLSKLHKKFSLEFVETEDVASLLYRQSFFGTTHFVFEPSGYNKDISSNWLRDLNKLLSSGVDFPNSVVLMIHQDDVLGFGDDYVELRNKSGAVLDSVKNTTKDLKDLFDYLMVSEKIAPENLPEDEREKMQEVFVHTCKHRASQNKENHDLVSEALKLFDMLSVVYVKDQEFLSSEAKKALISEKKERTQLSTHLGAFLMGRGNKAKARLVSACGSLSEDFTVRGMSVALTNSLSDIVATTGGFDGKTEDALSAYQKREREHYIRVKHGKALKAMIRYMAAEPKMVERSPDGHVSYSVTGYLNSLENEGEGSG